MDLQRTSSGIYAQEVKENATREKKFKRKKHFVNPAVQGIYIAFSVIPTLLATLFCTYWLLLGGEYVLREAKERPLVPIYTMRQTVHALEQQGYTKETAPKVAKLKNELATLKTSLENTYYDTLEKWEAIRIQVIALLFCCLVLVGSLALLFSHRVAGPLFRIGKCIDLFAEGKDSGPVRLRKRDQYKDLAASLEKLRRRLLQNGSIKPE